jgi:hypothetical protein
MDHPVEEGILPPVEIDEEAREMEKLRLQAASAEAELAKVEMQAVRTETGGNGRLAPSPKVLPWRKLRAKLEAMGGGRDQPQGGPGRHRGALGQDRVGVGVCSRRVEV